MAGLDIPNVMAPRFYPVPFQVISTVNEVLQDKDSATMVVTAAKEPNTGDYFVEQILNQTEEIARNELNSNVAVMKNMKQLDVENSSSEDVSISLGDPKRRKREEE
ncbi:hypothetical protein Ancab_002271, partial [Ancistrocladus abbreviatus]